MNIEIPFLDDKELQARFEKWLISRGNEIAKARSIHAASYIVVVKDVQDAFWIGTNYTAIMHKLYDGPLTRTLG